MIYSIFENRMEISYEPINILLLEIINFITKMWNYYKGVEIDVDNNKTEI